ncbi:multidrug resistance efflux transporter family protein [Moraxella nasibovis]|uniref:multidrug resistance efflux transporter family protein n=1 Tax=Moraxella nasibovis TaxID=2904120 RepID=UPI0024102568|nr:multidrug resistance efflux transporter family protein [Moraxella nasibovis]WFF38081.1 multidrug resistance efflux transporter family protein [Moraxella nasibovis]
MARLILFGLLAGFFFSSTFVLNELMASQGGHWFWSASGRYIFMWLILSLVISLKYGTSTLLALCRLFHAHAGFWCVAGSIGFGGFYAFLCFGADHAPSWVIAATFQFTSVASLIVLAMFGESLSKSVIGTSLLIFTGVLIANVGEGLHDDSISLGDLLLLGALPALLSGFCFPIGNQLVWYAANKAQNPSAMPSRLPNGVPSMTSPLIHSAVNKVWLLTTGSLPFWLVLGLVVAPESPSSSQIINTFLVALFAGVIATSIFLFARSQASTGGQVAAIDATQASEMIFAIFGGMILLGSSAPSALSLAGIGMVVLGLYRFANMKS